MRNDFHTEVTSLPLRLSMCHHYELQKHHEINKEHTRLCSCKEWMRLEVGSILKEHSARA